MKPVLLTSVAFLMAAPLAVAQDTSAPPSGELPTTAAPADDAAPLIAEPAGPEMADGALPLTAANDAPVVVDDVIGTPVETIDGAEVGAIRNITLSEDGQADAAVVRFGGFLGFGRTQILVPMDDLTIEATPEAGVSVRSALTEPELKALPPFQG